MNIQVFILRIILLRICFFGYPVKSDIRPIPNLRIYVRDLCHMCTHVVTTANHLSRWLLYCLTNLAWKTRRAPLSFRIDESIKNEYKNELVSEEADISPWLIIGVG